MEIPPVVRVREGKFNLPTSSRKGYEQSRADPQASNPGQQNGVQQIKHQYEFYGEMTAIQYANDKPSPATSSSAQGTVAAPSREANNMPEGICGRGIRDLNLWCSSHWSRSVL